MAGAATIGAAGCGRCRMPASEASGRARARAGETRPVHSRTRERDAEGRGPGRIYLRFLHTLERFLPPDVETVREDWWAAPGAQRSSEGRVVLRPRQSGNKCAHRIHKLTAVFIMDDVPDARRTPAWLTTMLSSDHARGASAKRRWTMTGDVRALEVGERRKHTNWRRTCTGVAHEQAITCDCG